MARGGGDNFVVAGIGKRGDGITPIVRIGTAGNPALLFQRESEPFAVDARSLMRSERFSASDKRASAVYPKWLSPAF